MKHLIIDGLNFAHRARAGMQFGPNPFLFNFFRNLRAQVELHKPDRVWYVLEGRAQKRYDELPEYKANREIKEDDPEREEKQAGKDKFFADLTTCLTLLQESFPITVIRHPNHECDDVIAHLVDTLCPLKGDTTKGHEVVVASSDTDFIQLLQSHDDVKLYNPMKKVWVEAPPYDYVMWKSLCGDGSDNIPGLPGCGKKTAEKVAMACIGDIHRDALVKYLCARAGRADIYHRNRRLIMFERYIDTSLMEFRSGVTDWDKVKALFDSYRFESITNEKSWKKFVDTFNALTQ